MATKSIHTVDVDDAAFQRFNSLFQKYREQVRTMPGAWGDVGKAVKGSADGFKEMTAALLAQKQLMHEQVQEMKASDKLERDAVKRQSDSDKAQKKAMDERKKSQKQMADTTKTVAKNIAEGTVSLLKWVSLGGLAGIATGALGLWGLDRLAGAVGAARSASQGLGITTGQQQAFGINYGRYLDPNSNLQNIADAQSDYAKRAFFSMMGVDPTGKNAAQLAVEMAPKAKAIFDRGDQSQQYAQAHGLLQFYTMNDLRRLHAATTQQLEDAAKRNAADNRALGMSDQAQLKWQNLSSAMERGKQWIENTFVDVLSDNVIPALSDLTKGTAQTAVAFLSQPQLKDWLKDAATGIKNFADYLLSPGFQSNVKTFVSDFALIVQKIVDAMVALNIIPDPHAGGSIQGGKTVSVSKNSWETNAARKFQAQGFSQNAAAGLAANAWAESGGQPMKWGDWNNKTKSYEAYGIAQWHADRRADYAKMFGHSMESVTDPQQALAEQLQYMGVEFKKQAQQRDIGWDFRSANQAGNMISQYLERPKDAATQAQRRGADAQVLVTIMNQTGASVAVQGAQLPQ